MSSPRIHKVAIVEASPERVFDFLVDPEGHSGILPGLIEVTDVPKPLRVGSDFHFKFQMYKITLSGEWSVTKLEYPHVYEGRSSGGAVSFWRYELKPVQLGTQLELSIEYTPPQTVLSSISQPVLESLNEQSAQQFLDNIGLILKQKF
ncbi:MAG TPA: SRPBCC family protein [Patescibacteria group bacterium]